MRISQACMSENDFDIDQYQDELNKKSSCGGCVETWTALSSMRKKKDLRRSILKQIASTIGVSAVALSGIASAAEDTAEKITVREETDRGKEQTIAQALRDPEYKIIKKELKEQGYQQRIDKAIAQSTTIQEEGPETELVVEAVEGVKYDNEWESVVIPFESKDNDETAHVAWTSASTIDRKVGGIKSVRIVPEDGTEPYWVINTYTVSENGDVQIETDEVPNFLGCNNPDTGCIAQMAAAYAGQIWYCTLCIGTSGWLIPACAWCIIATTAAYGTRVSCTWCND